jgi:hypothetical protein
MSLIENNQSTAIKQKKNYQSKPCQNQECNLKNGEQG